MQCGGDSVGKAGDRWGFLLVDGSNLLACTAKLVVIDLQTGAKVGSRTYNQAELEAGVGDTMQPHRIYRIDLLRTPSDVPFIVELTVGADVFRDECPGGSTLPWTIFVE